MRKILLSLIVASLFVLTTQAQIKKGSIFLGGDIGAYTQKTKWENATDQESKGLNISPVFGKFIKDNLVIGGSLSYSVNNTETIRDLKIRLMDTERVFLSGNIKILAAAVSTFLYKEDLMEVIANKKRKTRFPLTIMR